VIYFENNLNSGYFIIPVYNYKFGICVDFKLKIVINVIFKDFFNMINKLPKVLIESDASQQWASSSKGGATNVKVGGGQCIVRWGSIQ